MGTGGSFPVATWRGSVTPAGLARASQRFDWRGLLSVAALVLAAVAVPVVIMPLGDAGTTAAKASPCGKTAGPFTVQGTKVLAKNGSVFISYGMTVSGLQEGNWTQLIPQDLAKIAATANDWCANTIRIQLNQDLLLGPNGTNFDPFGPSRRSWFSWIRIVLAHQSLAVAAILARSCGMSCVQFPSCSPDTVIP